MWFGEGRDSKGGKEGERKRENTLVSKQLSGKRKIKSPSSAIPYFSLQDCSAVALQGYQNACTESKRCKSNFSKGSLSYKLLFKHSLTRVCHHLSCQLIGSFGSLCLPGMKCRALRIGRNCGKLP